MIQFTDTGMGRIGDLTRIIETQQAHRVFVVTGRASFEKSGAAGVVEKCLNRVRWTRFSDFAVNPSLEDALAGIDQFRQLNPDLVVAIGGGSVMDMAKLIKTLAPHQERDFVRIVKTSRVTEPSVPMVAIPTTAGTGSEATHFAVAYIKKHKFSLAHRNLLPEQVILDAGLTLTASFYQKAASGMDALCQAVESYWSRNSTPESRNHAARAITLILPAIEMVAHDKNIAAHQDMIMGSHLAGRAINITKTTAPHALSYALTTHHGLPHGHAVALVLGNFFKINGELARMVPGAEERFGTLHNLLGCRDAKGCSEDWYARMHRLGLSTDMAAMGLLDPKNQNRILDNVNLERLGNHPVPLERDHLARAFSADGPVRPRNPKNRWSPPSSVLNNK